MKFQLMYVHNILLRFGLLSDHLLGNSWFRGLDYAFDCFSPDLCILFTFNIFCHNCIICSAF